MSSSSLNTSFGAGIDLGLNFADPSGFDLGKNFLTPSSTSSAGGMSLLAAATLAAPLIGGFLGNRQASNTRAAGQETAGAAAAASRERGQFDVAGRNFLLDEELARQKDAGISRFDLANSGPAQYYDTRQQGFELAGRYGMPAAQVAQFTDMFGGYS